MNTYKKLTIKIMIKAYSIVKLVFLFLGIITFTSCNMSKDKNLGKALSVEGIEVEVIEPAGNLYKSINFLPLPINVAKFEHIPIHELECWILSERIKQSKDMKVDMVALIVYNDGYLNKNIILSIPSDQKKQTIKTTDLMDFSLNHSPVKSLLEDWLKQYKGSKTTVNLVWKDKQEALRFFNKYTESNQAK